MKLGRECFGDWGREREKEVALGVDGQKCGEVRVGDSG